MKGLIAILALFVIVILLYVFIRVIRKVQASQP